MAGRTENCSTCDHWRKIEGEDYGECWRYPPRYDDQQKYRITPHNDQEIGEGYPGVPLTRGDHLCGEHKGRARGLGAGAQRADAAPRM